jgi:hypothetical protein
LRFRQSVFFSILPWLLPLAYLTSCSKGFQIADSLLDQSSLAPATPRPGTPQTLTPPGPDGESPETKWISLKTVGHNDPNCLVLAEYDACIFYKNPFVQSVVALGTGLGQGLRKGQDLSKIQTFGVKLAGRTSQTRLESSSVIVTAGDVIPTQQKPVELPMVLGLQPKVSYKTDEQSVTALTHSYFWLQEMENQLKARTNVYFAAGKKIEVFLLKGTPTTLPSELINNAFWSDGDALTGTRTNWISVGVANLNSNDGYYEEGLEAEVLLHEMGHANFAFAKGYPTNSYDNFADNYSYPVCLEKVGDACKKPALLCGSPTSRTVLPTLGCQSAINEGLADFHYLMMFPDFPALLETNFMSLVGLPSRNMKTGLPKQIYDFMPEKICDVKSTPTSSNGLSPCTNTQGQAGVFRGYSEIHRLGAAYASILFSIYSNAATDKRAFEKTFLLHLQQISASTRFPEARDILMSIDEANFNSKNGKIIKAVFSAKGID